MLLFFAIVPRTVYVVKALIDSQQLSTYARVRLLTARILWPIILLAQLVTLCFVVFTNEDDMGSEVYLKLIALSCLVIFIWIFDVHVSKVIEKQINVREKLLAELENKELMDLKRLEKEFVIPLNGHIEPPAQVSEESKQPNPYQDDFNFA